MRPNFSFRKIFLLLFSFLIFNSSFLIGTVRYVSKTGNSTPPYLTWETAADSIQKCINISVFGDTIYVANGVYEEQVVMIPGLALIGAGTDSCVVDSRIYLPSGNRTITMKDSCLVTGFYIRTSNDFNYGYGIYATGQNGLITKNKFSNSNSGVVLWVSDVQVYKNYFFTVRSGIYISNSNSNVRKNEIFISTSAGGGTRGISITAFSDNYKPIVDSNHIVLNFGTGIYKTIGSSPIIRNNVIEFVQYGVNGIDVAFSDSTFVYNNLILIGTGVAGIYNYNIPYLQVFNNYIQGSSGTSQLGILTGGSNYVKNNVVTNTQTGIQGGGIQNLVVHYNNLWNNNINYSGFNPDTTNLSVDPMIMNDDTTRGDLDFHLQMFSPLIDTGDPSILDKDSTRSDIGLYGGPYGESYLYVDLPPRPPVNLTANVDTLIKLNWNRNTEADFNHYNLYRDTTNNFQIDSVKLVASLTDTLYYHILPTGVESLYFKLTGVDNQGNESNPSEEVGVLITSAEDEWKPLNNYILYQNYPNPFNPSTKIGYKLKERGYVKLYVYDIKGELVSVLVNLTQEAGYYEVIFDAGYSMPDAGKKTSSSGLASGVYIYQILVSGDNKIPVFSDIKKMLLVK